MTAAWALSASIRTARRLAGSSASTRTTVLGYISDSESRAKKKDGELVSYEYDLYDFNQEKLYEKPNQNIDAPLGKFEELKAVEDAVRYMKKGEKATLLVPSVLAFGTYGDDEKIPNDMPLIIKIKIL